MFETINCSFCHCAVSSDDTVTNYYKCAECGEISCETCRDNGACWEHEQSAFCDRCGKWEILKAMNEYKDGVLCGDCSNHIINNKEEIIC